jgi:hypothetical protein
MRHYREGRSDLSGDNPSLTRHLIAIARRLAAGTRLSVPDQEDYAARFATTLLCRHRETLNTITNDVKREKWIYTCALHALFNYQRHQIARRKYEISLPQTEDEDGNLIDVEFVCSAPSPLETLMRHEEACWLETTLCRLKPRWTRLGRIRQL